MEAYSLRTRVTRSWVRTPRITTCSAKCNLCSVIGGPGERGDPKKEIVRFCCPFWWVKIGHNHVYLERTAVPLPARGESLTMGHFCKVLPLAMLHSSTQDSLHILGYVTMLDGEVGYVARNATHTLNHTTDDISPTTGQRSNIS